MVGAEAETQFKAAQAKAGATEDETLSQKDIEELISNRSSNSGGTKVTP